MRRQDMVRAAGPGIYRRAALTFSIGVLLLGLLAHRLQAVDPQLVWSAIGGIGLMTLIGAGLATCASFWAVAAMTWPGTGIFAPA